jgi:protein phosphatase 1 regulatory subunit 37
LDRVCRDIFNTCVRNTEEAEKANREAASADGEESPTDGKAVWGMIEKSQLAKSIRLDDAKKVDLSLLFLYAWSLNLTTCRAQPSFLAKSGSV